MSEKQQEISYIIKEQIKNYHSQIEMKETGRVILVGDGIARVYGLTNCMANELLDLLKTLRRTPFRLPFFRMITTFVRVP